MNLFNIREAFDSGEIEIFNLCDFLLHDDSNLLTNSQKKSLLALLNEYRQKNDPINGNKKINQKKNFSRFRKKAFEYILLAHRTDLNRLLVKNKFNDLFRELSSLAEYLDNKDFVELIRLVNAEYNDIKNDEIYGVAEKEKLNVRYNVTRKKISSIILNLTSVKDKTVIKNIKKWLVPILLVIIPLAMLIWGISPRNWTHFEFHGQSNTIKFRLDEGWVLDQQYKEDTITFEVLSFRTKDDWSKSIKSIKPGHLIFNDFYLDSNALLSMSLTDQWLEVQVLEGIFKGEISNSRIKVQSKNIFLDSVAKDLTSSQYEVSSEMTYSFNLKICDSCLFKINKIPVHKGISFEQKRESRMLSKKNTPSFIEMFSSIKSGKILIFNNKNDTFSTSIVSSQERINMARLEKGEVSVQVKNNKLDIKIKGIAKGLEICNRQGCQVIMTTNIEALFSNKNATLIWQIINGFLSFLGTILATIRLINSLKFD